ncbi:hypothetical protein [Glutamicibacter sp. MCAF14]|uniref:hypothetical protein n=1 Tax=Glutamicibacter sp. MCAF14 TaxID=3233043 RepID=UPI003F8F38A8
MPNQPSLNPDALANLRLLADRATEEVRHAVIEPDILHKLLDFATAQPEVNSVEELDQLPHGVIVLDADDDPMMLSPDGEGNADWVRFYDPIWYGSDHVALPARVLYRPAVKS